ncbi:hypothetical protein UFOVP98_55 [uncultured Caudovirales phage]|jgi:hypothetical protein|uniref:Uncharacterized protein n=1 Tax=uncultured Caudovirales phage TaxID=2100421 RepID=A0A6J5L5I0_9CAUD|nr:hypothetical protein UFOVP98_55 [uncultured Caudovirales phage]CAB4134157.1 hypothetical protein UFOVP269_16 [uncultured Caudovirales phage]
MNDYKNICISKDCITAIDNYIKYGLHPGAYFKAIIDNDLETAIFNAHPHELQVIKNTIIYVRNKIQKCGVICE